MMVTSLPRLDAPRVALVEDDENLALLLRYNLEARGYAVDWIARGDIAPDHILHNLPRLVVLDWSLPGLAGIEVLRILRDDPRGRTLPVAMLTSRTDAADRLRAESIGVHAYIAKPFSVREVMATIVGLLEVREALAPVAERELAAASP
jgi:two-component system phosphate regulon response regulator PhoB